MNKLNLGCGQNKLEGFINIDKSSFFNPDIILELDDIHTTWPIESNSINEVYANHIIEHLGSTTESYFHFIKELYRVCCNGARIHIQVPHPKNDNFLHDATHIRPITEHHFQLFSKERNLFQQSISGQETQLGFYLDVDFKTINVSYRFEQDVEQQLKTNEISIEQVQSMIRFNNNIVSDINIELEVIKG